MSGAGLSQLWPGAGRSDPNARDQVEAFDYVLVGAGSAGAVLANRLSADPSVSVLLLEAGESDTDRAIAIPAAFSRLFGTRFDWNYRTLPQPGLGGRSVYWPRGKVLGGSSSINAMMWVTGFAADYDRWAELAGPEWSWTALRPLLAGIEVSVQPQRDPRSHTAAFLIAVTEAGYPVEDANPVAPEGFSQTLVTQHRGTRSSTATGYLRPVAGRPNLVVRPESWVTRVLFDGVRAHGVSYLRHGRMHAVRARAEVVLCGGTVNTPQLLMLSGIGDPEQLREHGIEVLVAAPDVGRNLRDHLACGLIVQSDRDTLVDAGRPSELASYLLRRRGMLTSNVGEAYGFVRSRPDLPAPDVELLFAPVAYVGEGLTPVPGHGLTLAAILLQPASRGTVRLASADPFAKPLIDAGYLSDPGGHDRAALMAGLEICERILAAPAMRGRHSGRFLVPEHGERLPPAERHEQAITRYAHTLYHPTSTARMGSDPGSVVDPRLRVRGVQGLRVADASVLPEIIRGHTNAPAILIGEQAAVLIRADRRG